METWTLPEGWEWVKLGEPELCEIIMGQSPAGSTYNTQRNGLPFFQGKADFGEFYPVPRKWCTSPLRVSRPGDILISVRAPVGPVNLTAEECIIGRGLAILRPKSKLENRYLFFVLRSMEEKISSMGTGSTFTAIGKSNLQSLAIPIPYPNDPARSLAEQRRIVARLEAMLSEVRALRDLLQSMRRDWSALIESALAEVFEALEDATPEPIGAIADVKGGKRLPKGDTFSEEMTPFPYIRVTDFSNYSVDTSNLRFLKPETFQRIRQYTISKDDVYISIAGTIGLVGTIPPELDGANLTENVAKLVFKEKFRNHIDKKYVAYYLSSAEGKKQIEERAKAAGQPKLALERIKTIEIPIPYPDDPARSLAEQRRIVAYLEAVQEEVSAARRQVEEDERRVTQLEQSILAAAFRGEV